MEKTKQGDSVGNTWAREALGEGSEGEGPGGEWGEGERVNGLFCVGWEGK